MEPSKHGGGAATRQRPHPGPAPLHMTFQESSIADITLFVAVVSARDVMPNITIPRAIERAKKLFGHLCQDCDDEALRARYKRMEERYNETLRTKA